MTKYDADQIYGKLLELITEASDAGRGRMDSRDWQATDDLDFKIQLDDIWKDLLRLTQPLTVKDITDQW